MLAEMGFEPTLCQKAVGMFGDDMGAAVAWLTDDQAQQTLPIPHYISLYLTISPTTRRSTRSARSSARRSGPSPRSSQVGWLGLGLGLGLGWGLGLGLALAEELI